jgi:hypothetical protein
LSFCSQLPGVASNELSLARPSPELKASLKLACLSNTASSSSDTKWTDHIPIGLKEFCAPAFASQAWHDAGFVCVELTTMYVEW